MAKIESSFFDIHYLDVLSCQDTFIHRLDPRVKCLSTMLFVVTVMSFDKYEISGLLPFAIFPVVLIAAGNLPPGYIFRKVLLAAPFALLVGIFNPFWDREILWELGPVGISGGWISFASIMIRFGLTVSAALILIASTGIDAICVAMGKMCVPRVFTNQLLFLYRYLFVLLDEATRMFRAWSLRSFGEERMRIRLFSHIIGQLLLRTIDRAQRIHQAMLCRGFDGRIRLLRPLKIRGHDMAFLLAWSGLFALLRLYDVPQWLGKAVTGFST
jgi:cobalt/nickel transport system permease protein